MLTLNGLIFETLPNNTLRIVVKDKTAVITERVLDAEEWNIVKAYVDSSKVTQTEEAVSNG